MIVVDVSTIPLPGKNAEHIAAVKAIAAYLDQRWPVSMPRMVTADITDGRVHVVTMRASLAETEDMTVEQETDAPWQPLAQTIGALIVPGSFRRAFSRVL